MLVFCFSISTTEATNHWSNSHRDGQRYAEEKETGLLQIFTGVMESRKRSAMYQLVSRKLSHGLTFFWSMKVDFKNCCFHSRENLFVLS